MIWAVVDLYVYYCRFKQCQFTQSTQFTCAKEDSLPLLSSFSLSASSTLQGTAADRFFHSLSTFIQGLDTKNNVKVSTLTRTHRHWLYNSTWCCRSPSSFPHQILKQFSCYTHVNTLYSFDWYCLIWLYTICICSSFVFSVLFINCVFLSF